MLNNSMTDEQLNTLYHQALHQSSQQHYRDALDTLSQILASFPTEPRGLLLQAKIYFQLADLDNAQQTLLMLLATHKQNAEGYYLLGKYYEEKQQPFEAWACFKQAQVLAPCKTYHFATLYIQKNIVDEPLKMLDLLREYDEYLRLYPNESSAYHNRSELLKHLGLYELALKDEEQAVRLSPNFAMGWCNKAFIQLTLGDYLEGWKNYEWRWKTDVITFQDNGWPIPRWQGEEIGNAKLLVHAEQGFGDNLQFVRFAIEAKKRGLNIVVVSHKPVEKLINYNLERYQVPFSENGQAISHLSYYVSMMSLPHYLGTTVDTIPYAEGYLQAEPERFAKWQAKITACDKLKVGLVWAGSTKHNRNQSRSLQFKQLSKLLELNAEFYCLQKDITEQDLVDAQAFENLHFFYQDIEDFSDTAALVAQMDFVISVDTSVAHLSGAMAKSTWVMLTYHPDFRWLLDRDDSPWYHSVCLFRQDFDYNWQTVIDRIYQQLKLTVQEHQNV